uniref:Apolipoprotein L3 n=1 Tax=Chromera velia CCMP2878 TaxID=1169474 RepID=A0A0G4FV17_9ALVE|eukprot:Cvel_18919.t1-p1 / transcript=Cvel_18919.t1 / gene=Cvel_18919 / organism=Chromera_velia_CCMP2878 / gene_product=hypothetical protein / transcript_product=hypothetical protein / location=Cvel_scaffold1595:22965-24413(+) / protein_length=401 / sequence_SO=supercontig / SO=protein_coding / is_pseudo=false
MSTSSVGQLVSTLVEAVVNRRVCDTPMQIAAFVLELLFKLGVTTQTVRAHHLAAARAQAATQGPFASVHEAVADFLEAHEVQQNLLVEFWQHLNAKVERVQFLIQELRDIHRNINVATVTGASVSACGNLTTAAGLALAPFTRGLSFAVCTPAGLILSGLGSLTSAGASGVRSIQKRYGVRGISRAFEEVQEHWKEFAIATDKVDTAAQKLWGAVTQVRDQIDRVHLTTSPEWQTTVSIAPGAGAAVMNVVTSVPAMSKGLKAVMSSASTTTVASPSAGSSGTAAAASTGGAAATSSLGSTGSAAADAVSTVADATTSAATGTASSAAKLSAKFLALSGVMTAVGLGVDVWQITTVSIDIAKGSQSKQADALENQVLIPLETLRDHLYMEFGHRVGPPWNP